MNSPFEKKEYTPQTFFQKLFGILPKENSIIELNNTLAEKGPENISIDDIGGIASKYHVNLYKTYPTQMLAYYKDYIHHCLTDKKLSDDELKALDNLKFVFNLKDKDTKEIFDEATQAIYKGEAGKAIADSVLSNDEEQFLLKLERNLQIPHDLAMSIYGEETRDLFTKAVTNAISDQKLSPDEEKQLQILANNLHIKIDTGDGTKALLDKYKLLWQIDNGILPEIDCGINLQKNETCHFTKNEVIWHEQRAVTQSFSYSSLSYRVNLCKGLSWRMGDVSPQHVSDDAWKKIDTGDLFLTNKRVIFMGSRGNKTIAFNKILDFTLYTNGIIIQKDTGKSPFLEFDNAPDVFAMILGRFLTDQKV